MNTDNDTPIEQNPNPIQPMINPVVEKPIPVERTEHTESTDGRKFSNILKVKADPKGISDQDRSDRVKALAGAIAHGMRQYGEVYVRCFGNVAIAKGAKAVAIARGYVSTHGFDLYAAPFFITAEMDQQERTGLCFLCVSSKNESNPSQ